MLGNNTAPAIEVDQLTVSYEKNAVLWDIGFNIPAGKIVGIIGPNGAGKSTLMKTVLGLIKPVAGHINFFGQPIHKARDKIAYVPQRTSVDWEFPITAFDLVLMGRCKNKGLLKWAHKKDKEATYEALKTVEMDQFADKQINQLSGGQQQRLFIARALLQDADLYFMDEPFAGIDIPTEKALMTLFGELKKKNKTILIVHHDLATVKQYFDWVIMLNTCLIGYGPSQEIFTEENIKRTYGRESLILNEAAKMAQSKSKGFI